MAYITIDPNTQDGVNRIISPLNKTTHIGILGEHYTIPQDNLVNIKTDFDASLKMGNVLQIRKVGTSTSPTRYNLNLSIPNDNIVVFGISQGEFPQQLIGLEFVSGDEYKVLWTSGISDNISNQDHLWWLKSFSIDVLNKI